MSTKSENKTLLAATGGLLAIALLATPLIGSMQPASAPTKQLPVSVASEKTGADTIVDPAQRTKSGENVVVEQKEAGVQVEQATKVAAKEVIEVSRTAQEKAERIAKIRKCAGPLVQPANEHLTKSRSQG